MRTLRRTCSALTLTAALTGCCCGGGTPPQPRPYKTKNEQEARLFAEARRDLLPEDVRKASDAHAGTLVLWAGILRSIGTGGPRTVRLGVAHHYWDWIEDHGQGVVALSPRGEGRFDCLSEQEDPEASIDHLAQYAQPGDLIVAYGHPAGVSPDGTVQLRCRFFRLFPKSRFSTRVIDYGRAYALNGDPEDCRPVAAAP